jgi:adenylosuccinate lyase
LRLIFSDEHRVQCYLDIEAALALVRQLVAALLDAMAEDHERSTGPWELNGSPCRRFSC